MKHSSNQEYVGRKRKRAKKKMRELAQKQQGLAVKILPKNSNGSSNWEQLSKVIGYDSCKKKSMSQVNFQTDLNRRHSNSYDGAVHGTRPKQTYMSGAYNVSHINYPTNAYFNNKRNFFNWRGESAVDTNSSVPAPQRNQAYGQTRVIAMDCEMVGTGDNGTDSMIARVSIVNQYGDCLYDSYVKPVEDITDYRTPVSGIRPADLDKGKDLATVQREVQAILDGKILVGHALKNDLDVLFMSHPKFMIRDTSLYRPFRQLFNGQTPSLKRLTEKCLGVQIQTGEHSSVEDAQAAMQIYLMHKREWEKGIKMLRRRKLFYQQPPLPPPYQQW